MNKYLFLMLYLLYVIYSLLTNILSMDMKKCLDELICYTQWIWISTLKKWEYQVSKDLWILQRVQDNKIHVLHSTSPSRHFKLKRLVASPYIITAIWDITLLDRNILWIVWPRKISLYARQVLEDFFESCGDYSVVTISGGAIGVDMMCHQKSLDQWVPTIVVLWQWLRHAMQWSKRSFISAIVAAWWLVLSEFPLDMSATKWSFPQRNRIIAWMSEMLFVPAAGKKSGSLISIDFALQMHIPVYTVPGSIYDATSTGTNQYLSEWKIIWTVEFTQILNKYFTMKKRSGEEASLEFFVSDAQQQALSKLPATKNSLIAQWISLADITMLEIWWHAIMNEQWELMKKR